MKFFESSEEKVERPTLQLAPITDIAFNLLILFMVLSVFYQMEYALNISVPKAKSTKEVAKEPGEIVVNILKDGTVVVNDKRLNTNQLKSMLVKISNMFPNQAIIIRADKKTFHENVVAVLDACASAKIWNIAFSTVKDDKK